MNLSAKVSAFVEFLVEWFAGVPGDGVGSGSLSGSRGTWG
jgi:hypothetical protein